MTLSTPLSTFIFIHLLIYILCFTVRISLPLNHISVYQRAINFCIVTCFSVSPCFSVCLYQCLSYVITGSVREVQRAYNIMDISTLGVYDASLFAS